MHPTLQVLVSADRYMANSEVPPPPQKNKKSRVYSKYI